MMGPELRNSTHLLKQLSKHLRKMNCPWTQAKYLMGS